MAVKEPVVALTPVPPFPVVRSNTQRTVIVVGVVVTVTNRAKGADESGRSRDRSNASIAVRYTVSSLAHLPLVASWVETLKRLLSSQCIGSDISQNDRIHFKELATSELDGI
jgi:hypothetical protein